MEKYDTPDFARDFNKLKPSNFENIRLSLSERTLKMIVDNNSIVVRDPKLMIDGSRVYLEGRVYDSKVSGIIRIGKINETFSLRFPDTAPVFKMKANGNVIEAFYIQSALEPDHRIRNIPAIQEEGQKKQAGRTEFKHRLLEMNASKMSKEEIRAWIDTEGSLDPTGLNGRRGTELAVVQKHREPLDVYVRSLAEMGVRCKVYRDKRGMYIAKTTNLEGVAKVIREVGPFRTPQRIDQVRRLMEKLNQPTRMRRRVRARAKTILEL